MKNPWLLLSILVLVLVACAAVQDASQMIKDAGVEASSLEFPQKQAERLIASGSCPQIEVVEDLAMIHEFTNEKNPEPKNMISSADITRIQSACTYGMKSVTVDLKLDVESTIGPQGKSQSGKTPFFSYPFFIAVTSPGGTIMAKEIFAASMTYSDTGKNTLSYTEELRQIIPIETRREGHRYKVLVGFQLSKEQLAFNRKLIENLKARDKKQSILPPFTQSQR